MSVTGYVGNHGFPDGALVKHFVLDTDAEVTQVPTDSTVAVGSTAVCPSTGKAWILTTSRVWTQKE